MAPKQNKHVETTEETPLIGIDLGTTNSVVATIDRRGAPLTLPNAEGDPLTPSVVYFEPGSSAIVGKEAIKAGLLDPERMVDGVKRDMGKEVFHRAVNGKFLPPAAISGVILHRLAQDVGMRVGKVTRAVVTVPAYFNEPRRKATMDAARMAGLTEVELLNEPTAAALAFGHAMGAFDDDGRLASVETKTPGEFKLLVYDLGGGTFDVTLMRIRDRHFQALVCDGDVQLGGRDWDERIVDYAVGCFQREFDADIRDNLEVMTRLRIDAEEVKRSLSVRAKTLLRVQAGEDRLSIELTRDDLLQLSNDLLGRTRLTCELAMMEAKLTWDQLDAILLVGGSSRMPMVGDMLREMSGLEPNRSISPDEAVAHGAALYAKMLWGDEATGKLKEGVAKGSQAASSQARITNVNSHSLGIVGKDLRTKQRRVAVLIPRNTAIPHSNSRVFKTQSEGQTQIYIQVVEGESHDPNECAVLGECRINDLPDLAKDTPVTVTFAYRRDGRVFVEASAPNAPPFTVEIDRKKSIGDADPEQWALELIGDMDGPKPLEKPPMLGKPAAKPSAPRTPPPPPSPPPGKGTTNVKRPAEPDESVIDWIEPED